MRERLYRREVGGVWYAVFYDGKGRRHRRSTKCRDRRAAEAALRRFERAAQGAAYRAADSSAYSVTQALDDFLDVGTVGLADGSVEMYEQKASHLGRLLGDEECDALTIDIVARYTQERLNEGAAAATISKELVTLRRTMKLAKQRGLIVAEHHSVIPEFRAPYKPRSRYLTLDEFRTLIAEMKPHRQMWLVVAVYTGARLSEIEGLDWSDIDWRKKAITLRGTKTAGAHRRVPLHPLLAQVLGKERKDAGPIVGAWPNVRRDLEAACERAKIDKVTPNDLRRTFASWLKQAGEDSYAVAKLLGHTSSRMVEMVYGRLDERAMASTVARLPGSTGGCVNSVPETRGRTGKSGQDGIAAAARSPSEMSVSEVLGAGIEPATRGFSIRRTRAVTKHDHSESKRRRG
jgi:integrase